MVVVTTGSRSISPSVANTLTVISTSGTAEGGSAADLYRIPGRPLTKDHEQQELDPNTIVLPLPVVFG